MSKTKIEWTDYTINPVKGLCPMACSYCYARRMYLNPYYKNMYENQEIKYGGMADMPSYKTPRRIFVGSTMELFGEWIKPEWMEDIFSTIEMYPEHTFIFLTKRPGNLHKFDFPDNCWVGVSVTDRFQAHTASLYIDSFEAKVKFISFEPLLDDVMQALYCRVAINKSNWLIIGSQTKPYKPPKIEWIQEIVKAADNAGIPVFLKDNLFDLHLPLDGDVKFYRPVESGDEYQLRQEMPASTNRTALIGDKSL